MQWCVSENRSSLFKRPRLRSKRWPILEIFANPSSYQQPALSINIGKWDLRLGDTEADDPYNLAGEARCIGARISMFSGVPSTRRRMTLKDKWVSGTGPVGDSVERGE